MIEIYEPLIRDVATLLVNRLKGVEVDYTFNRSTNLWTLMLTQGGDQFTWHVSIADIDASTDLNLAMVMADRILLAWSKRSDVNESFYMLREVSFFMSEYEEQMERFRGRMERFRCMPGVKRELEAVGKCQRDGCGEPATMRRYNEEFGWVHTCDQHVNNQLPGWEPLGWLTPVIRAMRRS